MPGTGPETARAVEVLPVSVITGSFFQVWCVGASLLGHRVIYISCCELRSAVCETKPSAVLY